MSSSQERPAFGPQERPAFGRRQGGPRPVASAQEARQGVTGHNVRYVLGVGIAATIVAFAALYIIYFA